MQFLGLVLLGLAGLILEATLLPALKMAGVKADLLTVFLAIFAFLKGAPRGAALGFIYGLLEDLYLAKFLGLNALTRMVSGYLMGLSKDWLNQDNLLGPAILAFLATIGQGFLFLLVGHLAGFKYPWLAGLLNVVLPMAVYNGSLALLGYSFYQGGAAWGTRKRKIGS
ncbi:MULTISPECIES: rod shape-determining protein MreD [Moorella (nom. illeg.)]|uniref:rod shape-determining protein MreD n=1 Tax=Neomoorella TaxID=44260 RepID=UPI0006D5306B|nr:MULTISPECIES: rod shape-determining protein MreD [Moorella]